VPPRLIARRWWQFFSDKIIEKVDFKIKEYVTQFGPSKSLNDIFVNIFKFIVLIILIPVLLISWVIGQFKNDNTAEVKNDWVVFKDFGDFKIFRLFIPEDDLPDDLDYPEEGGDIYLFKLKSDPIIPGLEDMYFDLNGAETKDGLYLISYNHIGSGMALWCIDKTNKELRKVRDVLSIYWNLINEDEETVRLRGQDKKNGYDFFVTEKQPPTQDISHAGSV
jgi:hypothetical protein